MIQTKGLLLIGLIAILLFIPRSNGYICNKHPHAISYSTPPKRNNNDKYLIDVEGSDGITYVPGTTYISTYNWQIKYSNSNNKHNYLISQFPWN